MKFFVAKLLRAFSFCIASLPYSLRMFFGQVLGWIWFDFLRIRRKDILQHLTIAFPEISNQEKIRIGRASCVNMGQGFMDYFLIPFLDKENLPEYFSLEGVEHFQRARDKEKGVIIMTLHLGTYDFAACFMAMQFPPFYVISKKFKLSWLNDLWFGLRQSKGMHFISDRKSSFDILRAFKNRGNVVFVLDQYTGPPNGIATTFFGKATGSQMGQAIFGSKNQTPVVPIYNYRGKDGKIHIVVEPEIAWEEPFAEREKNTQYMTQKFTDVIEKIVRKYPEQWLWVHRRWKRF